MGVKELKAGRGIAKRKTAPARPAEAPPGDDDDGEQPWDQQQNGKQARPGDAAPGGGRRRDGGNGEAAAAAAPAPKRHKRPAAAAAEPAVEPRGEAAALTKLQSAVIASAGGLGSLLGAAGGSFYEMQASELLAEMARPAEAARGAIEAAVSALARALGSLPPDELCGDAAPELEPFFASLGVEPASAALSPLPPLSVTLASVGTGPRPSAHVHLLMPGALLREKDYLDSRYAAKRALYLAAIRRHLADSAAFPACRPGELTPLPRDPRALSLPLTSRGRGLAARGGLPANVTLWLHVAIPPDSFPAPKLAPGRPNLRTAAPAPSPLSNASVLIDVAAPAAAAIVAAAFSSHPGLEGCLALLARWQSLRGLDAISCPDGLSGTPLALLASHWRQANVLRGASPHGLFSSALAALAEPARLSAGVFWDAPVSGAPLPPLRPTDRAALLSAHALVIAVGPANFAARVTPSALAELRMHAGATVKALRAGTAAEAASGSVVGSGAIFPGMGMGPGPGRSGVVLTLASVAEEAGVRRGGGGGEAEAWDAALCTTCPQEASYDDHAAITVDVTPAAVDADAGGAWAAAAWLESVVTTALTDRARLVRARRPSGQAGLAPTVALTVRVMLEPANVGRLVDHGPSAESPAAAAAFRAFWGPRAELRRFRDGRVSEAVTWACAPEERRRIPRRIVAAALGRHFPGGRNACPGAAGMLDWALGAESQSHGLESQSQGLESVISGPESVALGLESLGRLLRSLPSLPLKVVAVQGLSPCLRGTAAAPTPHPLCTLGPVPAKGGALPRCVEAIDVAVQLEGSGAWPAGGVALRKTKAAFAVTLAAAVSGATGLPANATADGEEGNDEGGGEEGEGPMHDGCLELLHAGRCWRLRLLTERELAAASPSRDASSPRDDSYSAGGAAVVAAAHHAGLVASVASAHPSFGPACRLAARWVASHLFSPHWPHAATELTMVAVYADAGAAAGAPGAPASAEAALLRWLRLVGSHPFESLPLVVDPAGAMGPGVRRAVAAARPGSPLWLVTASDARAKSWTRVPGIEALTRVRVFAAASARALAPLLAGGGVGGREGPAAALLRTPLGGFDALLLLRPGAGSAAASFPGEASGAFGPGAEVDVPVTEGVSLWINRAAAAAKPGRARGLLLPGFDPGARYVAELGRRFGARALFFHDGLGGEARPPRFRHPLPACDSDAPDGRRARGIFSQAVAVKWRPGAAADAAEATEILAAMAAAGAGVVVGARMNHLAAE